MRIENQCTLGVEAACQWDPLAIERNFYGACVACPKDNLSSGMNCLHIGRTDDASHRELPIALDRYPCVVHSAYGNFKWLIKRRRDLSASRWWIGNLSLIHISEPTRRTPI